MKVKLTVLSITYNHEQFIEKALEGFIMQRTNFPFEVFVADDGSTDRTPDIIKQYADRYPHIIRPILRQHNMGIYHNLADCYARAESEYVALCEGDDYWTDSSKLQRQVDFLDQHPDHSICFHPSTVTFMDDLLPETVYPEIPGSDPENFFTFEGLLRRNFIQTSSVVYRWRFNETERITDIVPSDILPIDWFIHLLHAEKGKIGFIDQNMSTYRRHPGGIWWMSEWEFFFRRVGLAHLKCYEAVINRFKVFHVDEYLDMFIKSVFASILFNDWEQILLLVCHYRKIFGVKLFSRVRDDALFHNEVREVFRESLAKNLRSGNHEFGLFLCKTYLQAYKSRLLTDIQAAEFNSNVAQLICRLTQEPAEKQIYAELIDEIREAQKKATRLNSVGAQ